jgi:hypothetical protein
MRLYLAVPAILFFLVHVSIVHAGLTGISGTPDPAFDVVGPSGEPDAVAVSLAHGFPLWFEDSNGLRLQLCLDQSVETAIGPARPCLTEEFFPGAPISFPGNFGPEAFWWSAVAFDTFTSTVGGGDALLVLAQEAAFADGVTVDGDQVAFGRIRIRINVPVPGTYRVTHPYGERDYVVGTVSADREINQTQNIGNFLQPGPPPAGNFLLALGNGPDPATVLIPAGFPAENAPLVSTEATGIGPFLVAADAPGGNPLAFLQALDGRQYLTNPGTELNPITSPVTGSPFIPEGEAGPANFFRIRLLDPPANFFLNAAAGSQEILIEDFQLTGKVFNDAANAAPIAANDSAATAMNVPVSIDVLANDTDVIGPENAHGIDSRALGLPVGPAEDPLSEILLTETLTTENGGTVRRTTVIATGNTTFTYTPAAGFTGTDTFEYVVQDAGGLISAPAIVEVLVEKLEISRADYRPRTGRWHISGTSSNVVDNTLQVFGGPRAHLAPTEDGLSTGQLDLRLSESALPFALTVSPLPQSEVVEINIFLAAEQGVDPILFNLYFDLFDGDFSGRFDRTLSIFEFQPRPAQGISTFTDALEAIRNGRTYVKVHTIAFPDGELQGQITRPLLGRTDVTGDGRWEFRGKSPVAPGLISSVSIQSGNGIQTMDTPLRMK